MPFSEQMICLKSDYTTSLDKCSKWRGNVFEGFCLSLISKATNFNSSFHTNKTVQNSVHQAILETTNRRIKTGIPSDGKISTTILYFMKWQFMADKQTINAV
jgi:hypothetical protein